MSNYTFSNLADDDCVIIREYNSLNSHFICARYNV